MRNHPHTHAARLRRRRLQPRPAPGRGHATQGAPLTARRREAPRTTTARHAPPHTAAHERGGPCLAWSRWFDSFARGATEQPTDEETMSDTPTNMLFAADLTARTPRFACTTRRARTTPAAITLRVAAHDYAAIAAFIDDAAVRSAFGDAIGPPTQSPASRSESAKRPTPPSRSRPAGAGRLARDVAARHHRRRRQCPVEEVRLIREAERAAPLQTERDALAPSARRGPRGTGQGACLRDPQLRARPRPCMTCGAWAAI